MNHQLIKIAIKRALNSFCRYRISALGFNRKGELISTSFNKPRFCRKGGGIHAEMELMKKHTKSLKSILICRVNNRGKLMPIHPCQTCQDKANDLGIRILTVSNF